jgi:hypothetical protein
VFGGGMRFAEIVNFMNFGGEFLPGICRGGGPAEGWWRGSSSARRTPPPRFARSPSPGNPGEEFRPCT